MFTCQICGIVRRQLHQHIVKTHKISVAEYKNKYNVEMVSEAPRPVNRKSIWTVSYWMDKGYSRSDAIEKVREYQKKNSSLSLKRDHRKFSQRCKEYWMGKGYSDEESIELVSQHQSNASIKSSKFAGHSHTDETRTRISNGMKSYAQKLPPGAMASRFGTFDNGCSVIELKCMSVLESALGVQIKRNAWVLNYRCDGIYNNLVIEFYGDYWHGNPEKYMPDDVIAHGIVAKDKWEMDLIRQRDIESAGYDFFIIWESEWNKSADNVIQKLKSCLQVE